MDAWAFQALLCGWTSSEFYSCNRLSHPPQSRACRTGNTYSLVWTVRWLRWQRAFTLAAIGLFAQWLVFVLFFKLEDKICSSHEEKQRRSCSHEWHQNPHSGNNLAHIHSPPWTWCVERGFLIVQVALVRAGATSDLCIKDFVWSWDVSRGLHSQAQRSRLLLCFCCYIISMISNNVVKITLSRSAESFATLNAWYFAWFL